MAAVLPPVSIIVPARNEERAVGRCLDSLRVLRNVAVEILVVDDHSTDRTAAIVAQASAEDARARLVRVPPLPAGWTGKTHAAAHGAAAAQYEWLLFTDADTVHAPDSLADSLRFMLAEGIDCLFYSPEQECVTFWERVLQPAVFHCLSRWFSYRRINDPAHHEAAGNGQYLLIKRPAYEAVGGHAAVRNEILEDVRLAERIKREGHRLHFAPGRGKVSARMYHSLSEIWRGWAKNLYLLAGNRVAPIVQTTALVMALDVLPAGLVVGGITGLLSEPIAWLAGGMLTARSAALAGRWRHLGFDGRYALAHPISGAMLVGLLWYSCYRHAGGLGIEWKERVYRS